jgi:hypothetical protein
MVTFYGKRKPGSARDWTLAPDREMRRKSCLKATDAIIYGNTRIVLGVHRCGGCSRCCSLPATFWLKRKILMLNSSWYAIPLGNP